MSNGADMLRITQSLVQRGMTLSAVSKTETDCESQMSRASACASILRPISEPDLTFDELSETVCGLT